MHKATLEHRDLGFTDDLPGMYAAQTAGYAPVVRAWDDDAEAILDTAIDVAHAEGIEVGATCAAAVSGAFELADRGDLGEDDTSSC